MGITQTAILQEEMFIVKRGTLFCIRPIRLDDSLGLAAFYAQLSSENTSQFFQGFSSADTHNKAKWLTWMVYQSSIALVAVNVEDGNEAIVQVAFLDQHAARIPRVMLRYAIEHFDKDQREYYLGLKKASR